MKNMLLNFRDRMFRLSEDEPLSVLSITVLILLDIFLLIILFQGLDAQSRLLTQPDEYIPYVCQEIIIDKAWNENNRLDKLGSIVVDFHRSTYPVEERRVKLHPVCKEINDAIDSVKTDKSIIRLFEERARISLLRNEITRDRDKSEGQVINPDLESLPTNTASERSFKELSIQIANIDQEINSNQKVVTLWGIIDKAASSQETIIKAFRGSRFFFPIYEVLFQFLFLLPLLVVFYLWYKKSTKNRLQALLSTHLLVVVSIPIFLKIVQLILDIIPRQIIKKFIDLLNSLNLIAIWYYLVIGLAIAVSILLIYFLQKHLFNREKIVEKRIRNRVCVDCGKKLPDRDQYCTSCGASQYKVCPECSQNTYVNSNFCRECGKKI
jgi:hypothetical protein